MTERSKRTLTGSLRAPSAEDAAPLILVVDDDEDSRLLLETLLGIWGYRVLSVAGGLEAIGAAETARPDLVLMDVRMPVLNGFETAGCLRRSPVAADVPIVFLSGCAENAYREAAGAAGGSEYLVKPLDFDRLEGTLGRFLARPFAANDLRAGRERAQ